MEIIDNFLDPYYFRLLQKSIVGKPSFPWYTDETTGISGTQKNDGTYFTHMFYNDEPLSDYSVLLTPLIKKIPYDPNKLNRIKANLYPQSQRRIYHGWHQDFETSHKGCIFYLNTNNGYTIFKNKKVKSIENRLLLFDPSIPHRSTTCTDALCRMNINFNYGLDITS